MSKKQKNAASCAEISEFLQSLKELYLTGIAISVVLLYSIETTENYCSKPPLKSLFADSFLSEIDPHSEQFLIFALFCYFAGNVKFPLLKFG